MRGYLDVRLCLPLGSLFFKAATMSSCFQGSKTMAAVRADSSPPICLAAEDNSDLTSEDT